MAKITAEEKEATRIKILAAARKIFRLYGYEKAQMKMIAKDVEIGVSTLYGYYASKVDLFTASFLDIMFKYDYNYDLIQKELENGLSEGITSLLLTASLKKIENDRELVKSFYIVSISNSIKVDIRNRYEDDSDISRYIKKIIDIYDSQNESLCAFSRIDLVQTIIVLFEAVGVEYFLDEEMTGEMVRGILLKNLKTLFAGKYKKY